MADSEEVKPDYQVTFEEHWKDIVCNPDGTLNLDQVMRELHDFSFMLNEVPKVYCHVTGNKMSYPNYFANDVIAEADESYRRLYETDIEWNDASLIQPEASGTYLVYCRTADPDKPYYQVAWYELPDTGNLPGWQLLPGHFEVSYWREIYPPDDEG